MDKYIYGNNNGLWYELQGTITFPASPYPLKNGSSAFWGSSISGITQAGGLLGASHQRQAEQLSGRYRRAGAGVA